MRSEDSSQLPVSRRGFVAATALVASIAGCSSLTQRLFEAAPVGLPAGAQDDLSLAETTMDSVTAALDGPAGTDVEITSHAAVYSRAAGFGGK